MQRGSKKVYTRVANDEKECLTVLVNVAADSKVAPSMVLYPYNRMPSHFPSRTRTGRWFFFACYFLTFIAVIICCLLTMVQQIVVGL